ncbi:hypothetical protein [Bradyrhizobium sp. DASA03007]|uniref:hypothetical protein n=1 Tax=unclassified Bradyrhizobium TaxID=2631580 RepID=UPI003F6E8355
MTQTRIPPAVYLLCTAAKTARDICHNRASQNPFGDDLCFGSSGQGFRPKHPRRRTFSKRSAEMRYYLILVGSVVGTPPMMDILSNVAKYGHTLPGNEPTASKADAAKQLA